MVTVPAIEFLGYVSSFISGSTAENPWYVALYKPALNPPGWVFGLVWPLLYLLMGLSLAMVLNARGAKGRGLAVTVFLVQLVCNFIWSPLFFGLHEATLAFYLLVIIFLLAAAATLLFGRIRPIASWLMLPYLCWLGYAGGLSFEIMRLNPGAETLVPPAAHTQI